ncbi:class I SAM-dependent methyltransferase [Acinetobacter nectaris]|uniref:class I SAM-dependent methyltransferase n=1 Tax=Acinetobacter nectaris TaxID=1219382 RepID=UPI001F47144B|nr:class I SAM-dependent methyltransferase [Acinetobacter nectaris]MCF9000035.1 class I SAM-dependent methyltransferase [Acinetobacter nectaris]MCF9028505.1 class I SAM-dependent methyltransferase [Acinetobacter nectaris]
MQFVCWFEQEYEQKASEIVGRLQSRGVNVDLQLAEKINAKFLRLHPELALVIDRDGLSIAAQGMKMQPDWYAEIPRLKRASLKTEMLARATQSNEQPTLIDATAGLGHDALLMAKFGAQVRLVERHPILFTLLEEAYESAKKDIFLASITDKIQLIFADSASYLEQLAQTKQSVDVVYLDPMFPQRDQNQQGQKKQAQVKKQMQLLHMLLPEHGEMDLGDHLLIEARKVAKRVIVKRPRHAVFLNNEEPKHQWLGDACRFDAYFNMDT